MRGPRIVGCYRAVRGKLLRDVYLPLGREVLSHADAEIGGGRQGVTWCKLDEFEALCSSIPSHVYVVVLQGSRP